MLSSPFRRDLSDEEPFDEALGDDGSQRAREAFGRAVFGDTQEDDQPSSVVPNLSFGNESVDEFDLAVARTESAKFENGNLDSDDKNVEQFFTDFFERQEAAELGKRRAQLLSSSTLQSPSASQSDDDEFQEIPSSNAQLMVRNDDSDDKAASIATAPVVTAPPKQVRRARKQRRVAAGASAASAHQRDFNRLLQSANDFFGAKAKLNADQITALCRIGDDVQREAEHRQVPFALDNLLRQDVFSGLVRRHDASPQQVLVRNANLWIDVWMFALCAKDIVNASPLAKAKLRQQAHWRINNWFHGPEKGLPKTVGDWRIKNFNH